MSVQVWAYVAIIGGLWFRIWGLGFRVLGCHNRGSIVISILRTELKQEAC